MAKATHVVKHKRLYMAVAGVLTHFPEGSLLTMTDKQAKKMGKRVEPLNNGETTDLTAAGSDELTELKARAKELGIDGAHKMKPETIKQKIAEAEANAAPVQGE